ncbi:hypothetical protein, partial [[Eubacterium] cellulosolvens]
MKILHPNGRVLTILIAGLMIFTLFTSIMVNPIQAQGLEFIKKLTASPPQADSNFGGQVAVSGDIIVIGEHLRDHDAGPTGGVGRAYIFNSDGDLKNILQSPAPLTLGDFGWAVAVSGDTIVVGEPDPTTSGDAGNAHIFNSNGNFIKSLQSPSPEAGAWFGMSVAVSENRIIVGEPSSNSAQGRAYIFDSNGNLIKTLQSPSPQAGAWFGYSVSISGDHILVGEPLTTSMQGRAHIFDSNGNFIKTLQSPSPTASAWFGWSLDIDGNDILIGEPLSNGGQGRVYIFDSNGNFIKTLQSPSPEAGAWFGWSVATDRNYILIGETRGAGSEGRAHLFDSTGNLIETLQSPTPEAGLYAFGWSVAIDENIIAITDPSADISGTSEEGAAYLYRLSGLTVGGLVTPVNKLVILAPYLAIAGLI